METVTISQFVLLVLITPGPDNYLGAQGQQGSYTF